MSHFLIAQRLGMTLKPVDVVLGANRRPTGKSGLYATARFGTGVDAVLAFTVLKNITT
jgi:predicted phage gp36 major capsid-like protein